MDVDQCLSEGGAVKVECSDAEKPVAWGCHASIDYCCCAPKDSK